MMSRRSTLVTWPTSVLCSQSTGIAGVPSWLTGFSWGAWPEPPTRAFRTSQRENPPHRPEGEDPGLARAPQQARQGVPASPPPARRPGAVHQGAHGRGTLAPTGPSAWKGGPSQRPPVLLPHFPGPWLTWGPVTPIPVVTLIPVENVSPHSPATEPGCSPSPCLPTPTSNPVLSSPRAWLAYALGNRKWGVFKSPGWAIRGAEGEVEGVWALFAE